MIANTDAVIEPRTMVVHSLDTLIADVTVLGPGTLDHLASWAKRICFDQL